MASRKEAPTPKITFQFVESKFHRNIHVDGAWGGVTTQGSIFMSVYSQTPGIPKRVTHDVEGLFKLGKETKREGSDDIIREVEATLLMNLDVATVLRDWLSEKIEQVRQAAIALEDARMKGVESGDTGTN